MNAKMSMYSQHQKETRHRVDTLIKIILIASFGSLLVAIAMFFKLAFLSLPSITTQCIRISSWLFTTATILGVLTLYTIAMRDYLFGERSRKDVRDYSANDIATRPRYFDECILVFSHLGIVSFILGMLCFTYAVTSLEVPIG